MPDLVQLTYSSVSTHPFSHTELLDLLAQARKNNASSGVTGILLYTEGSFFQVLEGEPDVVHHLFNQIRDDPRHTRVTAIIDEPIPKRDFSEWTMGYAELSAHSADTILGANDFFTHGNSITTLRSGRARKLLQAFKSGRWRQYISGDSRADAAQLATIRQSDVGTHLPEVPKPKRANYTFAYQPIVDIESKQIFSYEALIRGSRQESAVEVLQQIPPGEMHRFDEQSRLYAIRLAAHLGLNTRLNLNFLPRSTETSPCVISSLLKTCTECGLRADQIVIEILEREIISDYNAFQTVINESRGAGVIFAIDDFGSGYAGLNLLAEFQPNLIKLDMQLVREIQHKGPRQAIVRGIQRTCEDLGIDIIAEGVESTGEYHWLKDEGIALFQGDLLAKPGFESLAQEFVIPD